MTCSYETREVTGDGDWLAHSTALHVTPTESPLTVRGPEAEDPMGLFADVGFIEMFEHGNRVMTAIELLRVVGLGAPDDYQPLTPRDDFDDAYARTNQPSTWCPWRCSGSTNGTSTPRRVPGLAGARHAT
jgi:hypothetical protein